MSKLLEERENGKEREYGKITRKRNRITRGRKENEDEGVKRRPPRD